MDKTLFLKEADRMAASERNTVHHDVLRGNVLEIDAVNLS